jgi:hypothetical protein
MKESGSKYPFSFSGKVSITNDWVNSEHNIALEKSFF